MTQEQEARYQEIINSMRIQGWQADTDCELKVAKIYVFVSCDIPDAPPHCRQWYGAVSFPGFLSPPDSNISNISKLMEVKGKVLQQTLENIARRCAIDGWPEPTEYPLTETESEGE